MQRRKQSCRHLAPGPSSCVTSVLRWQEASALPPGPSFSAKVQALDDAVSSHEGQNPLSQSLPPRSSIGDASIVPSWAGALLAPVDRDQRGHKHPTEHRTAPHTGNWAGPKEGRGLRLRVQDLNASDSQAHMQLAQHPGPHDHPQLSGSKQQQAFVQLVNLQRGQGSGRKVPMVSAGKSRAQESDSWGQSSEGLFTPTPAC